MSFELPDGKISRTLPEQVGKNTKDIDDLKTGYNQIEDVKIVSGVLHVYLQDGTDIAAGTVKGLTSVSLNSSKHLIVTYDDGTTSDLGLLKSISSFSIDGSQHLIATFNDGSTQDLGAIFTGNIAISGSITANSIVENMTGYSYHQVSKESYVTPAYTSIVKTGNKITIVACGTLNMTGSETMNDYTNLWSLYFTIPSAVGAKIVPLVSTRLDQKPIKIYSNAFLDVYDIYATFSKSNNSQLDLAIFGTTAADTGITRGRNYAFRYEVTFLLSDSLIPA